MLVDMKDAAAWSYADLDEAAGGATESAVENLEYLRTWFHLHFELCPLDALST